MVLGQLDGSGQASGAPPPPLRPGETGWAAKVPTGIIWPTVIGLVTLVLFVGGFGIWASRAPLAGAAIAPGTVVAAGQNLTVQHKEGGIVETIHVREGETVTAGQPLFALQTSPAKTELNLLRRAEVGFLARDARLRAERDDSDLLFDEELRDSARETGLENDLREQRSEFLTRRIRYAQDAGIIDQQIAALDERIAGLEVQRTATQDQMEVLAEELVAKKTMVDRELTPRSQYLLLLRQEDQLQGQIGGITASIGEARTRKVEAEQSKARLQGQRAETAVSELNETRRRLADTQERMRQAADILERTTIRSPAEGVIVKLNINTVGGVVGPGAELAEVLPTGGELIVEARLSQLDSDIVNIDQQATLRFSALNTRTTPEVPARVTYKAADTTDDPRTLEVYYVLRLAIAEALPDGISADQITPGMPVEVFIQTGDRTFLDYLLKPITDAFSGAFRED